VPAFTFWTFFRSPNKDKTRQKQQSYPQVLHILATIIFAATDSPSCHFKVMTRVISLAQPFLFCKVLLGKTIAKPLLKLDKNPSYIYYRL
jgi:hypothetical protein